MSQGQSVLTAANAARILGADLEQGPKALQAAFRAAVKRAHPDRPGGDAQRLRAVIEAYNFLKASAPEPARETAARPTPAPTLEITPVEALCGGRHLTQAVDGRKIYVILPAGLRAGDQVRVAGQVRGIAIASQDGLAVIGDHLCLSVDTQVAILRQGGTVSVETPLGPRTIRITRQDGVRGLVRVVGKGLPPRAGRPRGDLLIRLRAVASSDDAAESEAQSKLRRFAADWAA